VSNVRVGISLEGKDAGASSAIGAVNKALGNLSGAVTGPVTAVGKLTQVLGGVGLAAAGITAIAGVFQKLGQAMTGPIGAASDLGESLNKARVVFGASAKDIEAFATTAAASLGQSKQQALEASASFGNLFVSMGLAQKPAADLSTRIVSLASDLSSFNNIKPEEALEKLRAGLVGETEPLRSLGVNINAAAVETKAFALGLQSADGTLTESAKVQARYALIVEQTKTAHNDFANTSMGMANAGRIIQATFADIQTEIGQRFLPTIEPLVSAFAKALPAALDVAKPALDRLGQGFASFVKSLDVLRPALDTVGRALAALARGDMDTLRSELADLSGALRELASGALTAIGTKLRELADQGIAFLASKMTDFAPTGERFGRLFAAIGDFIKNDLLPFLGPAVNAIREVGEKANAAEGPMEGLAGKINGLSQAIQGGLDFLGQHNQLLRDLAPLAVGAGVGLGTFRAGLALTAAVQAIAAVATGGLTAAFLALYTVVRAHPFVAIISVLAAVGSALATLYATNEGFRKLVDTSWAAVKVAFTLGAAVAGKALESLGGWLSTAGETVGTLATAFGRLSADAVAALNGLNAAVSGSLDWLAGQFASAGPRFIALLAGGIRAAAGAAVAAAQETVARIAALLPHSLADEGPLSIPTNWHDPLTGNLAEVGEALRVQFERTFSVIEQVEIDSENKRAKLTRDHQRAQEIEETKYQRRLIDLEEDLAAAKGKARQGVLDRIAQLHEDHGRRVEDQEQAHADRLVEIEFELADDLRDAEERQALQRGAALRELLTDFDALNRQMADKARDIERTMQDGLREATRAAADAARDVWERAQEQIESAIIGLAKSRAIRELRAAFGFGQDQDASGRSERREAEDLQHRRQLDLQQLLDRQAKDDADFARERAEKRTEIEEDQRADGEKLEREYQRDLAKATTDEEKAKATARLQEKRDELKAKHEEENRARTRREQQEDQERARRRAEEMDERRVRETAENAELARRKQRAAEDAQFRKDQASDLQRFTDDLDNKDLAQRITNIEAERDARIRAIGEALVDKQNQIIAQANAEREVMGDHYAKAVDDLRTKFLQKIGPLMGDELAAVSTLLDLLAGKTAQVAAGIATMTAGAPGGSGGPLSAPLRPGGKPGETAQEVANYYANLGQTPPAAVQAAAIFGNNPPPASVAVIEANPNLSAGGGSGPITVPKFATGGVMPHDGLAYLHKDEPVFTPAQAKALGWMAGQGGGGAIDYDKLAAALARQPIVVTIDGQRLFSVVREYGQRDAARNGRGF
jgi:hypothetical protein